MRKKIYCAIAYRTAHVQFWSSRLLKSNRLGLLLVQNWFFISQCCFMPNIISFTFLVLEKIFKYFSHYSHFIFIGSETRPWGLNLRILYPHFTIMFHAIVMHVNVRNTLSGAHTLFEVSFLKDYSKSELYTCIPNTTRETGVLVFWSTCLYFIWLKRHYQI